MEISFWHNVNMLNHAEIALLLTELQPLLGAVVQKVSQSAPEEMTLALRKPGRTALLSFRLQRGNPRFLLTDAKKKALEKAPAFTMALRKHLTGARLLRLDQPPSERIARFVFDKSGADLTLVAELVPPGGNLVLLSQEEKVVARLFNDDRNGAVGRIYAPPPPIAANVAASHAAQVRSWEGESFHAFLATQEQDADTGAIERDQAARRGVAKKQKLLARLDEDWTKAGEPGEWKRRGELLQQSGADTQGHLTVKSTDPETGETVVLDVNPALTTRENIAAFFKRARRAESARIHIAERRAKLLEADEVEAIPAARPGKRAAPQEETTSIPAGHVYRYPGGSIIVAGRSATENENVTYRWAKGDDHWLHARDVPGSHVLLRHSPPDDLESMLDEAARLALHYSFKRGEPHGDVILTRRKYVQRVRGAPGKVNLVKEENRRVTVSAEDLTRLEGHKIRRKQG